MITLQEPKLTKAKKHHVCDFCGQQIHEGQKYYDSVHICDGVYHWRSHVHCHELSHWLKMYDGHKMDEGLTGDVFRENIKDTYLDIMDKRNPEAFKVFSDELNNVLFRHKLGVVYRHYKPLKTLE